MSAATPATEPKVEEALPAKTRDKYQAAAQVAANALKAVIDAAVEGAKVLELCQLGDRKVEEGVATVYAKKGAEKVTKGSAHPTCVSVNSVLQNYSPLPSDTAAASQELKKDDVVKIVVGVHIDGYASLDGETIVVGSSQVTGVRADLLAAAHNAAEAALRLVKVGAKNIEVTEGVAKVLAEYDGAVKGVEGVFSHQQTANNIQAKKTISLFPTSEQKLDKDNNHTFEEGEVYTINAIVTNAAEPKSRHSNDHTTTIYGKTPETKYALKMKTSRAVFSEISKKAGDFPFTLRLLEDEKRGKLGVQECVQHGLLQAHNVSTTGSPASDLSAQAIITFAATKNGVIRFTLPPPFYSAERVKPEHEIKSEEVKALLAKGLKAPRKKAAKPTAESGNAPTNGA